MLLKTFHIQDFQSVGDSNSIGVGDITCLVGKNEAGKTALLKALYRLNPITKDEDKFDVTDDYPRSRVTEYEQEVNSGKRKHSIVTTAVFEIEAQELAPLEEDFGTGVLPERTITLSRGYKNETDFRMNADERVAGEALLAKAHLLEPLTQESAKWNSLSELASILRERGEAQQERFNQMIVAANNLTDPDEKRDGLAHAQSVQETAAARSLRTELESINAVGVRTYIYTKYLEPHLPHFLYFDDYYQMRGCENIEALQQRIAGGQLLPSDHPIIGLVELAGLKLQELVNLNRTQDLKNKLQGASNHLTKKILKYWSQNRHLRLAFDVRPARLGDPENMRSGTNIWAEVVDQKHFVNTALGTRSRGFVWFFSFLAWYSRLKATAQRRIILLLDEPGLSLHAKAQEDLLRYFEEELKGAHQVIYSTHSPFMVDSRHFERCRIVQDKSIDSDDQLLPEEEGTKVLTEVLDAGQDSLFPLQGALGYEIYQTLFVGPNSLVIEGASDLLYIQVLSGLLTRSGRNGLDPAWTLTPVGGADKVPTFVALIGANKSLRVATLIDFQRTSTQMVENLYKRKLLNRSHVLTFADFTGKQESDIEDMFEPGFYLRLVNEEYKPHLANPVELSMLNKHYPRILVSIEEHFSKNPLKVGSFNHYRPARYFAENIADLSKDLSSATLDRFEAAFRALNKLLKS